MADRQKHLLWTHHTNCGNGDKTGGSEVPDMHDQQFYDSYDNRLLQLHQNLKLAVAHEKLLFNVAFSHQSLKCSEDICDSVNRRLCLAHTSPELRDKCDST